jgi:hypothetical protein
MVANIPDQSSQFNVYHFHDMGRGWMVNLVELSMLSSDAGMLTGVLFFLCAGVAYVKYTKASAAALAIENLHEATLNGGQGPRLKVMLAESPHARYVLHANTSMFQMGLLR